MKNYKTGLIIFLFLAIIISLFPPYEFLTDFDGSSSVEYQFLFSRHNYHDEKVKLLFGEIVLEYLFAGFISVLIQVLIDGFKNRKIL